MTVQHVSVVTKNPTLISGSDIGTIVKHYLKKDFYTFNDFKTVITKRFALTPEQRKIFDEADSQGKEYLFAKGKTFEAETIDNIFNKYSDNFDVINFNDFREGEYNKILVSDELGICAIPDILLKSADKNILCEIKASECGGKSTENYKYQLVAQSMLVEEFYHIDVISRILFSIPNKATGEEIITLSTEEKTTIANEIKEAIKLLKEDLKNGTLEFYSFEKMMERFEKAETIKIQDEELVRIAREIEENKIQFQAYKASEDELKSLCKQKFGAKPLNIILTESDGMQYHVKYTCSRETYHTLESKHAAIEAAKQALRDAEAIEVGSVKASSRFGVKVSLI
jgi:hypothetical protein